MKQNNPKETEKGCLICGYKPKLCLVLCVEEEFDKFDADENNHHACYECEGSLIPEKLRDFISQAISDARREERENNKVTGDTSDGYHTFNELYDFRKVFNACLFNEWYAQGKYEVHKSTRHSDGEECFGGGWFIVMATLPTGQISNHYEMKDWGLFDCQVRQRADKWDGHTAKDVLDRLQSLTTAEESIKKLK